MNYINNSNKTGVYKTSTRSNCAFNFSPLLSMASVAGLTILSKRSISSTPVCKIKDDKTLEQLKKAKFDEHLENKNEMQDIDDNHEKVSYHLKTAIYNLFNFANRQRDVDNVWSDTNSHNADKDDLTMKHWNLGRKCKSKTYDCDSDSASYTDSNHSKETLNLEREREFLNVGKEKIQAVNQYSDSVERRLNSSDINLTREGWSMINHLIDRKNHLTEQFMSLFTKQTDTFNKYESIRQEIIKKTNNTESSNSNNSTNTVADYVPVSDTRSGLGSSTVSSTEAASASASASASGSASASAEVSGSASASAEASASGSGSASVSASTSGTRPERRSGSLLDDYADTSTEPADYTGGDD